MRALDLNEATWRKSSYSNQDGGQCLEVADDFVPVVPVRDSKNPQGPALTFAATNWSSFLAAVKGDDLSA
ncbi:DUF397 domain-containing protein [Streptomyces sp. ISL-111]|uniref:DUF397 domain-containing protein n=1 Tax=unclassified Streptomyces TaxID=2593676 RepID=UPI001BE76497|nr:DUF397 domain-containing protein [Streptomyces sp. ISL-111]MBT2380751.1 DUF397 domain-containing protein [Streptomyces sp. ISL-111]